MIPALSPEQLASRYSLLCRATQSQPDNASPLTNVSEALDALNKLLKQDLLNLAREGSPDDFADIYFALEQELERFREFCAFPTLAQKVVIGFGGAFSAGKSTLINTLLGEKLLAFEVDPTTSLPTYILHGEQDGICALNLFHQRLELSHEEFLSLTHDEKQKYGSSVAGLLNAAFITRANLPWQNLALIDTPGYSKPDGEHWNAQCLASNRLGGVSQKRHHPRRRY
jgi:ribosome biogenesis GTPase A